MKDLVFKYFMLINRDFEIHVKFKFLYEHKENI